MKGTIRQRKREHRRRNPWEERCTYPGWHRIRTSTVPNSGVERLCSPWCRIPASDMHHYPGRNNLLIAARSHACQRSYPRRNFPRGRTAIGIARILRRRRRGSFAGKRKRRMEGHCWGHRGRVANYRPNRRGSLHHRGSRPHRYHLLHCRHHLLRHRRRPFLRHLRPWFPRCLLRPSYRLRCCPWNCWIGCLMNWKRKRQRSRMASFPNHRRSRAVRMTHPKDMCRYMSALHM